VLPDGREVTRFTLGADDGLRLCVLDLGAVVQSLWVPDASGHRANVVLGSSDLAGHLAGADDYYGAVVGRYANRIAGAEIVLDGRTHPLAVNHGAHTLHGGSDGFDRRLWHVDHVDHRTMTFSLVSPDGDQGFPGQVRASVSYEVDADRIRISYRAESDATTVVNLTQHAHFNLAGEGSGSVDTHLLQVAASRFTPVGPDLIPTGELREVDGTPLDLRSPRAVGSVLRSGHEQVRRGRGLDHNFVLDHAADEPAAVLSDPLSGRTLTLFTDQPGIQVYSCNFQDGTHVGTSGSTYRQGDGIALETQCFPDAPHHEGEPGWPSAVLRPGETYRRSTVWAFSARP